MRILTVIFASVLIASGAQPAWAYCPPELDYSAKEEFRRVDIVAVVKVESVTWLDEHRRPTKLRKPLSLGNQPGGFDPYVGAYYTVRLVAAFKGHSPNKFRVFSENTTGLLPVWRTPR